MEEDSIINEIDDDISDELLEKENNIVKEVDKRLLAERIAIEVKANIDILNEVSESFKTYLATARADINYNEQEITEILELSKDILKEKYKIMIISSEPFIYEKV